MKTVDRIINHKGISLVSAMIGIGLTAVMALAVMRMTKTQSQAQQGFMASNDFIQLSNLIQSKFLRKDYCMESFGGIIIPDDPTDETVMPIMNLSKPEYTFDSTTGVRTQTGSVSEYIIPADVDAENPKTGLQFGNVSLMSMNLIRSPNSTDLFLELNFMKRNSDAFGGRDLSKRIPLQAIFDTNDTIVECYSDFSGTVETAVQKSCEDIGRTAPGPTGNGGVYDQSTNTCKLNFPASPNIYQDQNGFLVTSDPTFTGRAHCCDWGTCTPTATCPSGFTIRYTSGRTKTCTRTDITCCGVNRRWSRDYSCDSNGPLGKLVP